MISIQEDLRNIIKEKISPLIDADYVLWDLPYHFNVGDVLIWKGEEDFLNSLPYKCIDKGDSFSYNDKIVKNGDIIILHGGGNFGDLYRKHQEFRLSIIEKYPNNKIIIFPQSVFYDDEKKFIEDMTRMSSHKNLFICARDEFSFNRLKSSSKNNILLVPDLAYYINFDRICINKKEKNDKVLFLQRIDPEKSDIIIPNKQDYEYKDWPTFEKKYFRFRVLGVMQRILKITPDRINRYIYNTYADLFIKESLVKIGIKFLNPYKRIITTRLHGLILATLLGKEVEYLDNRSHKVSDFATTWLSRYKNVRKYT